MSNTTSFARDAWQQNAETYEIIRTMPFNAELASGTLSEARFKHYITQDAHYLIGFGRALTLAAAKAPDPDRIVQFAKSAEGAIVVERALHGSFFQQYGITPEVFTRTPLSPACHHYVSYLLAPIALDASAPSWPVTHADAIVSINMIHIAPWSAAEGLMAGANRLLASGAVLYLYGPFMEDGRHTAPSNAAFDASLRNRNSEWGVRDLGEVTALAGRHGLAFEERVAMPANNLSVIFRRRAS